jgi:hypothetical protein
MDEQSNYSKNEKEQFGKIKLSYKYREKPTNMFYENVRRLLPELILPEGPMIG